MASEITWVDRLFGSVVVFTMIFIAWWYVGRMFYKGTLGKHPVTRAALASLGYLTIILYFVHDLSKVRTDEDWPKVFLSLAGLTTFLTLGTMAFLTFQAGRDWRKR